MAVIGGRAHINGITFATNTHVVRGKLIQGDLSIKVQRLPGIRVFNLMDKVPLLRGVSKLAKLNLKMFLVIVLFLAIPWDWVSPSNDMVVSESIWPMFALCGFVVILVFILKQLWQFHGAEHKAFNIYTSGSDLSLSAVRDASRVSERCGTNLAVILLPIVFLLSSVTIPFFTYVVACSIGYEIFNWSSRHKRLKPAFLIAGFIQKYIVTAEPTEDQLRLAVATLSKAIECDRLR